MANHKNQHIVPRCYLKNFVCENNHTCNSKDMSLYVTEKHLRNEWKEKGINNKIFTESYFYNLEPTDESKRLEVEKFLSKIEHLFAKTIDKIKCEEVEDSDIEIIKWFTFFQHIRSPSFMEMMQNNFDAVARYTDLFNGNNDSKSEVIDLAKKAIISMHSVDNVILNQPSILLFNFSKTVFITSDTPVLHKFINYNDASLLLGKEFLVESYNNSIEKPLFYLPISPRLAFVSLDFLDKNAYLDKKNTVNKIDRLNFLMCIHAKKYVYSSLKCPFPKESEFVKEIAKSYTSKLECPDIKLQAKIHTKQERYIIEISDLIREKSTIKFTTQDTPFLKQISKGDKIELIEIYTNSMNTSGMRMAEVKELNTNSGLVEIKSILNLSF